MSEGRNQRQGSTVIGRENPSTQNKRLCLWVGPLKAQHLKDKCLKAQCLKAQGLLGIDITIYIISPIYF